jgi:hypothetical protein
MPKLAITSLVASYNSLLKAAKKKTQKVFNENIKHV